MQDAQLNFSHVQPTAMFGGVMDLQTFGNPAGFSRFKGFIERRKLMSVQVIHDQNNLFRFCKMNVDQVTHTMGKVNHGALPGYFDMSPRLQWCKENKEIAGAIALVLIIIFGHITRSWRQRHTSLLGQLFATFIKADKRSFWIVGTMIDRQRIFHGTDEVGTLRLWNTPLLFQPRLEFVFFKVVRTVSFDTVSTISNSMSLSASICIVHSSWPSGAWLHANWTSRASAAPSSILDRVRFGRVWLSAASMPSMTHFSRVRSTVRWWAPRAFAISASFQPPPSWFSSAINSIWARLIRRTEPVPLLTNAFNSLRSSFSSVTRYSFAGISSPLHHGLSGSMPLLHLSGKLCRVDY